MEQKNVIQLPQFQNDLTLAGCDPCRLVEICNEIREYPTHGFRLIRFDDSIDGEPLAGFYVRSWRFRTYDGSKTEGCSLHLFLSNAIPVYLFNFASCLEYQAPWKNEVAQAILKAAGLAVYFEYSAVEENA